jgi:serine/threonine-protein kinase PRP4
MPPDDNALQNNLQAVDDSDDSEGYYRITLGETLNDGRYQVFANLGKGMFSSVVKARDLREGNKEVAIKIVRSQEIMCVSDTSCLFIIFRGC